MYFAHIGKLFKVTYMQYYVLLISLFFVYAVKKTLFYPYHVS